MAEMLNDPETNREMLDKYRVKMKAPPQKSNRLTPTKVNWAEIEKQWGISREDLEKSGALNRWFTITSRRNSHKVNDPDGSGESWTHVCHFRTNPTAHIRSRPISSGKNRCLTSHSGATHSPPRTRWSYPTRAISASR